MGLATRTLNGARRGAGVRRGAGWITALISAFGLLAAWVLLNLIIGGQCQGKCVIDTLRRPCGWLPRSLLPRFVGCCANAPE